MRTVAAFLRRDFQIARSYRLPFIIDAVSAVFTLLSFRFVSQLIRQQAIPGGYFAFITTGLALIAVLQGALTVVGGNLRQEQATGTLESMLATGVGVPSLAAGLSAYPLASSAVRAAVYLLVGLGLGASFPGANVSLAVAGTALASVSFAGFGLLGAAFVLIFRQALAIAGWVTSLLALVGGVYFPFEQLPGWFHPFAKLSPFTKGLEVLRAAVLGETGTPPGHGASWASQAGDLAQLAVLAVVFAALGIGGLALSLRRARKTGGLSGY